MKALLVCIAALLYVLGWLAGLVAVVVLWCWSAAAVGWDDAWAIGSRRAGARLEQAERRPARAR